MDFFYIGIVLVVILVSMTLHEAMHAFMGYFLGDDTAKLEGRLTLNPLKHIDPFMTILLPISLAIVGLPVFGGAKPVPFNPDRLKYDEWGAAVVALVGPLTNLFIAFLAFGTGIVLGLVTDGGAVQSSILGRFISTAVFVNLGFFAFNILPIPPLDGSRVLYAVAPDLVRGFMEKIERYGVIILLMIILLPGSPLSDVLITLINGILWVFMFIFGV